MKLSLEIIDTSATYSTTRDVIVSLPCFLKSLAIAGQGFIPSTRKFLRTVGFFLVHSDYLRLSSFQGQCFSKPPDERYDPTERNQFSNLAGKAFADLFARRVSGAIVSFNYEAAMKLDGHPIRHERPDLICSTGTRMFAVEAKGFSRAFVSAEDMQQYKAQSRTGPLDVHFSVASVAYGLYKRAKIKYQDPVTGNEPYNQRLATALAKEYYGGALEYLRSEDFTHEAFSFGNRQLIRISLADGDQPVNALYQCSLQRMGYRNVSLVLDPNVKLAAETGNINEFGEVIEEGALFVDSDGIGLEIEGYVRPKDNKAKSGEPPPDPQIIAGGKELAELLAQRKRRKFLLD